MQRILDVSLHLNIAYHNNHCFSYDCYIDPPGSRAVYFHVPESKEQETWIAVAYLRLSKGTWLRPKRWLAWTFSLPQQGLIWSRLKVCSLPLCLSTFLSTMIILARISFRIIFTKMESPPGWATCAFLISLTISALPYLPQPPSTAHPLALLCSHQAFLFTQFGSHGKFWLL